MLRICNWHVGTDVSKSPVDFKFRINVLVYDDEGTMSLHNFGELYSNNKSSVNQNSNFNYSAFKKRYLCAHE